MKTMREKYFENYEKIQTPAHNRRGFTTEYRYKGTWYAWGDSDEELKNTRIIYGIVEVVSIAVLLYAALRRTPLNSVRLTSGLAMIAIIPWIAELWGVFRFITAKNPMTVSDYTVIRDCITIGGIIRAIVLAVGMICGLAVLLRGNGIAGEDLAVFAGHIVSAAASFYIFRKQASLHYRIYKNEGGKPGREM